MAQQKRGLIARMLEGKERSEEYARTTLPTNRWQLFWDIFKGNFWKVVKVNLLMLLFFIPVLAVIIFSMMSKQAMAYSQPIGSGLGGAMYPAIPNLQGLAEQMEFQNDLITYLLLALSSLIASIGLSGGMYVIRNMVWTEGIFVANDFWRGVKLNFKNALQATLFFMVVLTLTVFTSDLSAMTKAQGVSSRAQEVFLGISAAMSYVFLILASCMSLWMIALGVNYKMGFLALIRNSFLMTIGMLPQTLFFGVLAILPFGLIIISNKGFFLTIGIIASLLFGLAYALLVWLNFGQWAFDKYINPKISGAKVGRGIYDKNAVHSDGDNSAAALEYQRVILAAGRSQLVARPIKPIDDELKVYDLPPSYTRDDLKKLRESKEAIQTDTEAYADEHRNDERYVEYNRQFDEREKALKEAEQAKKLRKRKSPKILNDKK